VKFNGWVRIDRSILGLTMDGKLSNTEALVLLSLKLLADHATGMGKINGRVLRTYLPGLTVDTAKRTLQSLETKRYIFRQVIPQSRLIYPYWVNGYDIYGSSGKVRMLDLTQVFDSKDIRNLKYVSPETAPETAPEESPLKTLKPKAVNHGRQRPPAPETAPETHHYNNKEQEQVTITKNNTNSIYPDSSADAKNETETTSVDSYPDASPSETPETSPELSPESVNTKVKKHSEELKQDPEATSPIPPASTASQWEMLPSNCALQWSGTFWIDVYTRQSLTKTAADAIIANSRSAWEKQAWQRPHQD
jgi:hypothetical protein